MVLLKTLDLKMDHTIGKTMPKTFLKILYCA